MQPGEQSGLRTRIATTESVSLCERKKSWLRFWNSKRQFAEAKVIRMKIIEVKPFRGGWKLFETSGVEPVFVGPDRKAMLLFDAL